ncbi:MAG: protein-glutamate O-methyltransferase CheR [Proteobacteria bacterium]|nr:protein-glutamate O-methyltransferase CheR [Pseudomonadota bacterium]
MNRPTDSDQAPRASTGVSDDAAENEDIEIKLLAEAVHLKYGYDFRNYSRASLKRRVKHRMGLENIDRISDLLHGILYDPDLFDRLFLDLSINVTEMFRDPDFFLAVRRNVVPVLKTYPFVKVWHAGCSTGEEVYSMAILLKEEGLYDKAQIYATDMNEVVIGKAQDGVIPIDRLRDYTANYQRAGGIESFGDYYTARFGLARLDKSLIERVVFASHNLATDGVFGEMHLIVCRNVLIYFDKVLQARVLRLFYDSLVRRGFLCLGTKESVRFSPIEDAFEVVDPLRKIYRKK